MVHLILKVYVVNIELQLREFQCAMLCALTEDTIDLTAIGDSDIERAVAESLKESQGILGGQVTREDEEISKWVFGIIFTQKKQLLPKQWHVYYKVFIESHMVSLLKDVSAVKTQLQLLSLKC